MRESAKLHHNFGTLCWAHFGTLWLKPSARCSVPINPFFPSFILPPPSHHTLCSTLSIHPFIFIMNTRGKEKESGRKTRSSTQAQSKASVAAAGKPWSTAKKPASKAAQKQGDLVETEKDSSGKGTRTKVPKYVCYVFYLVCFQSHICFMPLEKP